MIHLLNLSYSNRHLNKVINEVCIICSAFFLPDTFYSIIYMYTILNYPFIHSSIQSIFPHSYIHLSIHLVYSLIHSLIHSSIHSSIHHPSIIHPFIYPYLHSTIYSIIMINSTCMYLYSLIIIFTRWCNVYQAWRQYSRILQ